MGWLAVLIGATAAAAFHRGDNALLFWVSVAATMGAFWTYGIMHNYAVETAKRRAPDTVMMSGKLQA